MEQKLIHNQSAFFIQRHVVRIEKRIVGLSSEHDLIVNKMILLNSALKALRKTHGFFQCRLNRFLKAKIQEIKNRIERLKVRCRTVLKEINQLENNSLNLFVV